MEGIVRDLAGLSAEVVPRGGTAKAGLHYCAYQRCGEAAALCKSWEKVCSSWPCAVSEDDSSSEKDSSGLAVCFEDARIQN
jgi:hypothetical protein